MASIHKDPRGKSPFFYCAFIGGDGHRKLRSTKQTDRTKARKICDAWAGAAEKARRGELTASASRKILAELVEISSGETLEHHCVESWLQNWVAGKEGAVAETTLKRYRQTCTAFADQLGARARAPLASINPADIVKFRDRLLSEGRKAETVNAAKSVLSIPFEAARRQGLISFNPVGAVDNLRHRASESRGREAFSAQEVLRLVAEASGDWCGAIILAATSGLRLGDVTRLRWEAIDPEESLLRVVTRKTGAVVVLPIHPDFTQWLSTRPCGIGKAHVFPELAGKRVDGSRGLSNQFSLLVEKAGIARRVTPPCGKGRTVASKTFHSLWHSFVSALANKGVASEIRKKLAGHSDTRTHAGYTHHELATLRAAIEKLPRLQGFGEPT